nr:RNA polymerase sigma factor [Enterocloster citroniae]
MLEEIYLAYYHEVYLYTLSLCGNIHLAEDLTSEAFYKALFSLEGQGQNVKFWLFKVSRNLFYDRLRKDARIVPEQKEHQSPSGPKDMVWEQMLKSEEARQLYRAILSLPPQYSEAVFMFYFLDYSVNEIAGLTGRKPGAVKTVLCRARKRLKKGLKEEMYGI